MKIKYTILLIGLFGLMISRGKKEKTTNDILRDEKMRGEIMEEIANNHQMMTEMKDHMRKSNYAMIMTGDLYMMDSMACTDIQDDDEP